MTIEEKDLALEESSAQEAPKEEEVRENIISEYGFDDIDDADKIDKLVEKEMEYSKKLSSAIGQKIKHRKEAEDLRKELGDKPSEESETNVDDLDKKLDEKLTERLEKKAIDELEYPDELKDEIEKIAKMKNISVKKAIRDPYITFKIEEYEKEQEVEEAGISRNNKSSGKKDYSFDEPPIVDMNTEEGRKEWDKYTEAMKSKGN